MSDVLSQRAFSSGVDDGSQNAIFVDGSDSLRGHFEGNPAIFFRNIETLRLQVQMELVVRFVISVG